MNVKQFPFRLLLPLCLLFAFVSCNEEDDEDIFVGRTWKVGNLFGATNQPVLTEEQAATVAKAGCFYIKFDDRTSFTGRTLDKAFSGTWSVDLKRRTLSLHFKQTGNPTDAVSKLVIERLQNTASYEGDYNFLKLKESESAAYILCRPYNE